MKVDVEERIADHYIQFGPARNIRRADYAKARQCGCSSMPEMFRETVPYKTVILKVYMWRVEVYSAIAIKISKGDVAAVGHLKQLGIRIVWVQQSLV